MQGNFYVYGKDKDTTSLLFTKLALQAKMWEQLFFLAIRLSLLDGLLEPGDIYSMHYIHNVQ
jgi:hypothetical protein